MWMLVQCAVRKASGLPVTSPGDPCRDARRARARDVRLLVQQASGNKPQDVGEPIPVTANGDRVQSCLEIINQGMDYSDNGPAVGVGSRRVPKYCYFQI